MFEGWTVLHSLSWIALAAGFLFLLLSLASGLLYVAEVIEEHSGLAKTVGKRLVYAEILLFVLLYAVDGLPCYLVAVGILAHLVYLQNFSRTWPTISLTSATFLASCVLVLASHFLSFRYFSARSAAASQRGRYTHYSAYDSRRGRHGNLAGASGGGGGPESFLDVATYFAVCVWLVPFYLFLSLSANDNVLPSSGESRRSSPTPESPTISVSKPSSAASPSLGRHQRQRSSMVKAALSSAFSLIPSALRPSTLSAQLPISDKTAARHDIPRSPSPTYSFDQSSSRVPAQATSSGFSSSSQGALSLSHGAKPRPQPLLRTSASAVDVRRSSPSLGGSNPGSPTIETVGLFSPTSPYYPPSSAGGALPSRSGTSQQQQRGARFSAGPSGSLPSSPGSSRFPSLSASLGPSFSPTLAHCPTSPVNGRFAGPLSPSLGPSIGQRAPFFQNPHPPSAPGMVRRNTTDRQGLPPAGPGSPSAGAFAQVGAGNTGGIGAAGVVGLAEAGRGASEATVVRGAQSITNVASAPPAMRRRGTVDGYGVGAER